MTFPACRIFFLFFFYFHYTLFFSILSFPFSPILFLIFRLLLSILDIRVILHTNSCCSYKVDFFFLSLFPSSVCAVRHYITDIGTHLSGVTEPRFCAHFRQPADILIDLIG